MSSSSPSSSWILLDVPSVGTCVADDVLRPFPRRRGERPGRESDITPALYSSSTFASRPRTRDLRASRSEAEGTSEVGRVEDEGFAVSIGVADGSLFNFLGFRFGVFAADAVVLFVVGAASVFFAVDIEGFVLASFGKSTPPADPALPCSAVLAVAAFLDRACFAGVVGVGFGAGDEGLDAMIVIVLYLSPG